MFFLRCSSLPLLRRQEPLHRCHVRVLTLWPHIVYCVIAMPSKIEEVSVGALPHHLWFLPFWGLVCGYPPRLSLLLDLCVTHSSYPVCITIPPGALEMTKKWNHIE